jgi:hypothetical protein
MKKFKRLAIAIIIAGLTLPAAAQIDTSGITGWPQMYNSMASWEEGAFGINALGHPDYGWGVYNMISHGLTGDSIFVIKLPDESYKRLWIVSRTAAAVYTIRIADLDGSNEKEVEIDMKMYADKQFLYYNLRGDSMVDEQPLAADWDLILTKFSHTGLGGYTVTGFLSNDGVTLSVFNAADSATAADATLADTTEWTDSISAIGNSWYKLQGMSIVPLDTIVYFVKNDSGDIYKMQVTYFESGFSGLGRVGIRKMHIDSSSWVHDTLVMGSFYAAEEYYSMENGSVGRVFRDFWDIGFKSGTFTSSIIANTTMGVELYTYPNADTSAWYGNTSDGPALEAGIGLSLYPVPATNDLFVKHELKTSQPVKISVIDMTGKQVMHREAQRLDTSELRLDISSLSPGVYILQLRNGEVLASGRFTKRQ